MNVVNLRPRPQILLFSTAGKRNSLKEFICYLKCCHREKRFNFAFSGDKESLHQELSIKENYLLDSVPSSLIINRDDNFAQATASLDNPFLKEMIAATERIDRAVKSLSPCETKLVSIAKALLAKSEYIFMERPEADLTPELLALTQKALAFEAERHQRQAFINSNKEHIWLEVATHWVLKNEKGEYQLTPNNLLRPGLQLSPDQHKKEVA